MISAGSQREQEAAGEVPKERLALGQEGGVVDVVAGDPPGELGERGREHVSASSDSTSWAGSRSAGDAPGLLLGLTAADPGLAGRLPLPVIEGGGSASRSSDSQQSSRT